MSIVVKNALQASYMLVAWLQLYYSLSNHIIVTNKKFMLLLANGYVL